MPMIAHSALLGHNSITLDECDYSLSSGLVSGARLRLDDRVPSDQLFAATLTEPGRRRSQKTDQKARFAFPSTPIGTETPT